MTTLNVVLLFCSLHIHLLFQMCLCPPHSHTHTLFFTSNLHSFIKFDSWGHTVDDFESVDTKSWRLWHSFGLFLPSRRRHSNNGNGGIIRPWTLQDCFWQIFVAEDPAHVFGNN